MIVAPFYAGAAVIGFVTVLFTHGSVWATSLIIVIACTAWTLIARPRY